MSLVSDRHPGVVCAVHHGDMTDQRADIAAVLSTLLRATTDARTAVVVRSSSERQAQDLARWLEQMHGSKRTVIASRTASADIELRLPLRLTLPAAPRALSC